MISTTFNILKKRGACAARYRYLAKALGGIKAYGVDKTIPLTRVLKINGVEDTFWALRHAAVLPGDRKKADAAHRIINKAWYKADCVYEAEVKAVRQAYWNGGSLKAYIRVCNSAHAVLLKTLRPISAKAIKDA